MKKPDHLAQRDSNDWVYEQLRQLRNQTTTSSQSDVLQQWMYILRFYATLHWGTAHLQKCSITGTLTHQRRLKLLRQYWPNQRQARQASNTLKNYSEQARYEGWVPSGCDLSDAQRLKTIIEQGMR